MKNFNDRYEKVEINAKKRVCVCVCVCMNRDKQIDMKMLE